MMLGNAMHVPIVHEVFSPTADELRYWHELDTLAADAERTGAGPILHGDPSQGEAHVVQLLAGGGHRDAEGRWRRDEQRATHPLINAERWKQLEAVEVGIS